jgi:hypothetical protein
MNYIIYTNYQLCFRTAWLVSGSKSNSYCDRRPQGEPFVKIIDGLYLSDRKSHSPVVQAPHLLIISVALGTARNQGIGMHTVVMGTGTCI